MTPRGVGDLDYACARVAARDGARPDALAWRRIETVRELTPMLDVARTTALAPMTAGVAADQDPHAIERVLRGHWRSLVVEVTRWMPARWQPAVAWSALATELAALDVLRRGESAPCWFANDPVYAEWKDGEPHTARDELAEMLRGPGDGAAVVRAWMDAWQRRLPAAHGREAPLLVHWSRLVSRHSDAMRAAPPGDATLIVQALRARLELLKRRAVLEATTIFVFLTLSALDIARLRGEIMRRRLFPRLAPIP